MNNQFFSCRLCSSFLIKLIACPLNKWLYFLTPSSVTLMCTSRIRMFKVPLAVPVHFRLRPVALVGSLAGSGGSGPQVSVGYFIADEQNRVLHWLDKNHPGCLPVVDSWSLRSDNTEYRQEESVCLHVLCDSRLQ